MEAGFPPVIDLGRGAFVRHEAGWLAAAEADALLGHLREAVAWEQRAVILFGREVLQPRLIAWAGVLPYRYSGQTLEPRPFDGKLAEVCERVAAAAGEPFNHVLLNRYRSREDAMGFHADDEPELGPEPVIASLSLGATRRFVLASRSGRQRHALWLGHGDLCVMGGTCQRHFRHGVPRTQSPVGERISLTFRRLLRAPA